MLHILFVEGVSQSAVSPTKYMSINTCEAQGKQVKYIHSEYHVYMLKVHMP